MYPINPAFLIPMQQVIFFAPCANGSGLGLPDSSPLLCSQNGFLIAYMKYKYIWEMEDERKTIGVSFSFSKKASGKYSSKRNVLNSDDVQVKEEKRDYIHSAEGKELKRFVQNQTKLQNFAYIISNTVSLNRGKRLRSLVNIKEANKQAKIYVGRSLALYIFYFMRTDHA